MLIMTLNNRGLDSLPRKLAIRRLLIENQVDVLFFHELMTEGSGIATNLQNLLFGWCFEFVYSKGK